MTSAEPSANPTVNTQLGQKHAGQLPYEFEYSGHLDEDVKRSLKSLKRFGFAVVRKHVVGKALADVTAEYWSAMKNEAKQTEDLGYVKDPHINKNGEVVRLFREKQAGVFPAINKVYSSEYMNKVAAGYYGENPYCLNREVFLTHEIPHPSPILPWHFDRIHYLKFYIYLKQVTVADGAFECVPGSHREGYYRASYCLLRGLNIDELPAEQDEEDIINAVPIEGNAGDLIVFDTDLIHRGGIVSPGHERFIMRGHTCDLPFRGYDKPRFPSMRWWIQSPFNFARQFGGKVGRIKGQGVIPPLSIKKEY